MVWVVFENVFVIPEGPDVKGVLHGLQIKMQNFLHCHCLSLITIFFSQTGFSTFQSRLLQSFAGVRDGESPYFRQD